MHGRPGAQKAVRLEVPPYVGEWFPESTSRDFSRPGRAVPLPDDDATSEGVLAPARMALLRLRPFS